MTQVRDSVALRFVVLTTDPAQIRGSRSEFLRCGLPISQHSDALEALGDLASDPYSALIVAASPNLERINNIVELACAFTDRSTYLAVSSSTNDAIIGAAIRSGIRGILSLPLTPDSLRISTGSRPAAQAKSQDVNIGELCIHLDKQSISWRGDTVVLPVREFMLLSHIAQAYPDAVPMDALELAYGTDPTRPGTSVRSAMSRLRRRLREIDPTADFIQTVQFAGYSLTA